MLSFGHPQPYQLSLSGLLDKGYGWFWDSLGFGDCVFASLDCYSQSWKRPFSASSRKGKLRPRGDRDLTEGVSVLLVQGTLALKFFLGKSEFQSTWGPHQGSWPLGRPVAAAEAGGDGVSVEAPDGVGRALGKQLAGWAIAPACPDLLEGSLRNILFQFRSLRARGVKQAIRAATE